MSENQFSLARFPGADGINQRVFMSVTPVLTSGGAAQNLIQAILPGNSLDVDGRRAYIRGGGQSNGALGTKQIALTIQGILIIFPSGLTIATGNGWNLLCEMVRLDYQTVEFHAWIWANGDASGGGAAVNMIYAYKKSTAFNNLFQSDITVSFTAQCANAADVLRHDYVIIDRN